MGIQRSVFIIILVSLIVKSFFKYFENHDKWADCPYPLDL